MERARDNELLSSHPLYTALTFHWIKPHIIIEYLTYLSKHYDKNAKKRLDVLFAILESLALPYYNRPVLLRSWNNDFINEHIYKLLVALPRQEISDIIYQWKENVPDHLEIDIRNINHGRDINYKYQEASDLLQKVFEQNYI